MDGKFEPFDPEAADFELDLDDPGRSHAFASVRRQYQRGLDALNSRPADCLPAIREPVKALEALCRTLTNKPKASLGEAVDHLWRVALLGTDSPATWYAGQAGPWEWSRSRCRA
ncbi:hypothetical protein GCM10023152_24550 [Agromyces bauzanensis]|uniref:Uncharacterized protein n=1 Tax=Agromyces bauzanensis TaxID=1308924 RepID=A0A917PFN6_9MICO|nr:hypothetical protein GCM10011372_11520 [Agromyces bauzanensis]